MNSVDNGGLASSMSLRDYFAAKAMAVFTEDSPDDKAAGMAYWQADAMLAARNHVTPITRDKLDADSLFSSLKWMIHQDEDLAWEWHCNVRNAIPLSHEESNRMAAKIMDEVFDVDITELGEWKVFEATWADNKKSEDVPVATDPRAGYRPFKNGDEFDNDDGLFIKDENGVRFVVLTYDDETVCIDHDYYSYDHAFNNYVFIDGTPFGVKKTE